MIQDYNSAELAAVIIAATAALRRGIPSIDGWKVAALVAAMAIALVLFATPAGSGAFAIVQRILVVFAGSYGTVAAVHAVAEKAARAPAPVAVVAVEPPPPAVVVDLEDATPTPREGSQP